MTTSPPPSPGRTYVLVDGENIDATVGSLFGRRPQPQERPRWDRLLHWAQEWSGQEVRGLFYLSAAHAVPMSFAQALAAIGYRPILLSGRPDQKVVDLAIQKTFDVLVDRRNPVALASHDGDFLPQVEARLAAGRRTALVGFGELFNSGYQGLTESGLELIDLEDEVNAFTVTLPRMRVIDVDEFDPRDFL